MKISDLTLHIDLEKEEQIQVMYTNWWPKTSGKLRNSKNENNAMGPRGPSWSGIAAAAW